MKNKYNVEGDALNVIDRNGYTFKVDKKMLHILDLCCWFVDKSDGYVKGTVHGRRVRLHRYLLNDPDGIVDHINRDKTDNRVSNLRVCTITESNWNRGVQRTNKVGIKGVACCASRKRDKKYKAQINYCGKRIMLGWFATAEEAGSAYKTAEAKYYGEYSPV